MKIWLDDIRLPLIGWTWIKTAEECIEVLKNHWNEIEEISLDHDLAFEHYVVSEQNMKSELEKDEPLPSINKTGYDVAKFIEEEVYLNYRIPPKMYCHSDNPAGRKNILSTIDAITRRINIRSILR